MQDDRTGLYERTFNRGAGERDLRIERQGMSRRMKQRQQGVRNEDYIRNWKIYKQREGKHRVSLSLLEEVQIRKRRQSSPGQEVYSRKCPRSWRLIGREGK